MTGAGHSLDEASAKRAHRVLQAMWLIASSRHDDAVARDIAELGSRLKSHIEAHQWDQARTTVDEARSWLASMAGVITSRMQNAFEPD